VSKNIIVLNGSPRKKGNTAALISAFKKGAEASGNTVTVFDLDSMNINGCKGCYGGGKDPESPCVQKDDMDLIYPVYKAADVIVLASPLYYWNLSGQLFTAINRLFAVAECEPGLKNPELDSVLLMAAQGHAFEDCITYYDHLADHLGWHDCGKVLCGGVLKVGDIKGSEKLNEAEQLGKSIG
jgi:NAD(P)H-dependent FMN reductase